MGDMPLRENVECIDMDERKIISDEMVREILLERSGARSISDFLLLDKQRQKEIVLEVSNELKAGPRQMSRVSGLTYNVVYYLCKTKS